MQVNQYIVYNGKLLGVKRTVKEHNLKPGFNQQVLKEWSHSDTLLKKDGVYYCCETIQEAEIDTSKPDIQLQLDFPE
jgi:hypothetical protein|tara:strand:+ start:352 stop:582 length:231 start_codon:yes stop_codon:yes gene_type:complete